MSNVLTVLSGQVSAASPTVMAQKVITNNNAAASVTVYAGYNGFTGTNVASVAFNLPAVAGLQDGTMVIVYSQAAVGTAATWASAGGTIVGAPATLTAGQVVTFIYNAATTTWLPAA